MSYTPKTVIIKADDLKCNENGGALGAAWTRICDDAVTRGIAISCGVIGIHCTNASEAAVTAIQNYAAHGIEFWGHGYTHSLLQLSNPADWSTEFNGPSVEYQATAMRETATLLRYKFGVPCRTFGAPGNSVDANTGIALKNAGVQVVFLQPHTVTTVMPGCTPEVSYLALDTMVAIEETTGNPSLAYLQNATNWAALPNDYVVLQVHPALWGTETKWQQYGACLDWLASIGCTFATPHGYFNV